MNEHLRDMGAHLESGGFYVRTNRWGGFDVASDDLAANPGLRSVRVTQEDVDVELHFFDGQLLVWTARFTHVPLELVESLLHDAVEAL